MLVRVKVDSEGEGYEYLELCEEHLKGEGEGEGEGEGYEYLELCEEQSKAQASAEEDQGRHLQVGM